ncbi:MAG: integration host factor subunit beta [Desulfovibrio sp.]|nr:integration host factor subunit beta [Desulfovibrio sp.]
MNKSELIGSLAEREGLTHDEAAVYVNTVFDLMKQYLIEGKRVEIRGFGSFKVKDYKAYTGRNPRTGASVAVSPKKLPFFKPSGELLDILND